MRLIPLIFLLYYNLLRLRPSGSNRLEYEYSKKKKLGLFYIFNIGTVGEKNKGNHSTYD